MKFYPLILFAFFSLLLSAQGRVEVSNPSKMPARTNKFKVIGKNNDGIILRLYGTEDVVNVFDNDLRLLATKTINFKNQDGLLQHIMLNKTGAVIFYLQQDRKYSVLYAQPVNAKFVEIGNPVLIDSIMDRKELVAANLRFKTSADQNTLLIYYPFFSFQKLDVIKFMCVDHALNVVYNKIVPVNKEENEMENAKSFLDNQGNGFMIFKTVRGAYGSAFDVLHLSKRGDFSSYTITTEKEIFSDPWFEIDHKNGNLVMTAFYDDKKKPGENAANGFLYASFDPANGTAVRTNYTPFSNQFIAELTGRESVTNTSLYTFNIRKAVLRNDGGALIIAESFIKDSREQAVPLGFQPGYNTYRTSEIYQFNDIIAFSINASGTLEWSSVMRKKQASEDDNGAYSSFLIANEKDKLRFLYLDEISSSATLNQYVLSSTGSSQREPIINLEEKDLMALPKLGKQISPNEVVMPSYKNNLVRLLKITF